MSAFGLSRWSRAKWLLGVLLVLDLAALLFVLSLANMTAEGPAKRSLQRSIAVLTEIDAFLDGRFETLQLDAARTNDAQIGLPDFPIEVSFSTAEVQTLDREAFQARLLARSAELLHAQGTEVFQAEAGAEISFFSPQGALRSEMDFLRPTPHRALVRLNIALAAVAALLALGLTIASRGYGRLLALGLSVTLAAAPFLILAVAVRFGLRLAADGLDDYLASEFLALGGELMWAPVRNGIIFCSGGIVMILAGTALARWSDARQQPRRGDIASL